MKKIKCLLLFGILILLGIGNSFSQFYDLDDSGGNNLIIPSIIYRSGWPSNDNYIDINYTYGDSVYSSTTLLFNRFFQNNHLSIGACYNSNGLIKGFSSNSVSFGDNSDCSSSSVIINANGGNPFNYIYMSSSTPISPYSERSVGSLNSYMYFDSTTFYTNYGYINDVPSGYTRQNIFLNNVGNYGIVSKDGDGNLLLTSIGQDSFNISENGGVYDFNLDVYSGYLILHFNTYSGTYYVGNSTIVLSLGSGEVMFNYYTGFYGGIKEISDNNIFPRYVGYLTYNNSTGDAYNMFINNVLNKGTFILTNGSFIGGIFFTSYSYSNPSYGSDMPRPLLTSTTTTQFSFLTDENVPTIIVPTGGTSQSTGSIAINTGLLNLCLNDLQFGELNSYLCNQLLSNLGNPVQIPGTSGQYISVSIDENGNLRYWITTQEDLAEQMSGFVWVENEDGSWSTVCPSGDCLGTILTQPINHGGSGFELTTGDVLDMMSNLTGWVGRCPFPYTDFRLGKNLKLLQLLQDYGFEYDPFIIINCSVAGFQYGRHTIDNTLFGDTFEHSLLYGDTPKHRSLFVFLDFVVILGLFGLFAFIKKIF